MSITLLKRCFPATVPREIVEYVNKNFKMPLEIPNIGLLRENCKFVCQKFGHEFSVCAKKKKQTSFCPHSACVLHFVLTVRVCFILSSPCVCALLCPHSACVLYFVRTVCMCFILSAQCTCALFCPHSVYVLHFVRTVRVCFILSAQCVCGLFCPHSVYVLHFVRTLRVCL